MEWQDVGIQLPAGAQGNVKVHCPQCHADRKHKADKSLSVNVAERVWRCHHCGWTGKLLEKKQREYFRPLDAELNLSEKAQQYLHARGFSTYTVQRFKIGESLEFMPQAGRQMNCLNFKYYRGDQLVNIKFRDGEKNFKMVKDAELIFFNLDSLEGAGECVITEGEFDCMAAHESGYFEVVSVPNGAPKFNANSLPKLEYLDNCYTAFSDIKKIILATDNDEPGINLRNELARRLGRYRCYYIEYPEGCKDLNEVLLKYGKERVKQCIANAQPFPVDGIFRVEDIEPELDYYYLNGFKGGVKIGYEDFDRLWSARKGELTTVTGIPGSGKSAVVDQILVRLSSRHGWKHGVCSFENQPTTLHISKLSACFIGRAFYRLNHDNRMNETEYAYAKYFINEHFYFFRISDIDITVDGILEKAAELVLRFGIDSLLIDPWNCLEHNVPAGMTETQFVSKCLTKITNFAKAYDIHIFLIAHPTKIAKDKQTGKYEVPNLYSISGSAHFFNKTDNGFTVYRDFETNEITIYVQKVRFFFVGKIGYACFHYDLESGRYAEQGKLYENELSHYLERLGVGDFAA